MSRGDIDVKSASNAPITCVKWLDNKGVHLLSSWDNGISTTNVTRRKKGQSDKITLKCPTVVKSYNEYAGGVDKHDRLKVAYEVDRRSKTSVYLRIAFDMMDQLLVDANILYNSIEGVQNMASREFGLEVAKALCEGSKNRKRSIKVTDTTDKNILIGNPQLLEQPVLHLPAVLMNTNRRRCALCKINNKDIKAGFECNVYSLSTPPPPHHHHPRYSHPT